MTEAEWLTTRDPTRMLDELYGKASERKMRLLADNNDFPAQWTLQAGLVRDIFGNPFRPVAIDLSWLSSTAIALAQAIYADRAFDRLPILADALQDAGCENADILSHCRSAGPHVRGCWVVDLVLGKK